MKESLAFTAFTPTPIKRPSMQHALFCTKEGKRVSHFFPYPFVCRRLDKFLIKLQ